MTLFYVNLFKVHECIWLNDIIIILVNIDIYASYPFFMQEKLDKQTNPFHSHIS